MHHHHGHVAIAALRHHVAHVHLIDGDVPARAEVAQLTLCLFDLLAANEEAALRLQHQGRVGSLNILECLRHHVDGRAEHARQGSTHHDRRSGQASRIAHFSRRISLSATAYRCAGHRTSSNAQLRHAIRRSSGDQTYWPAPGFSCLFLHESDAIHAFESEVSASVDRHPACSIAVMTTPSRQARLHTRRLRNAQRPQSRPGRRADGFARSAARPARTRRSQRPAHWRFDGSPIGSRRTLPTTERFSSGSRARMPYASRG